jgi:hypothetical protein
MRSPFASLQARLADLPSLSSCLNRYPCETRPRSCVAKRGSFGQADHGQGTFAGGRLLIYGGLPAGAIELSRTGKREIVKSKPCTQSVGVKAKPIGPSMRVVGANEPRASNC